MADNDKNFYKLLDRNDCVLIVIDVQDKLLPQIADRETMVNNIVKLTRFAKIIDIPVIVTEQEKLGDTVPEILNELSDVQPIRKIYYSCFGSEEFKTKLESLGRKTLILTGMETHICVMQTALEALPNYNIHVITDAVSSRYNVNKDKGLLRMHDCGIVSSTTEMVIFELLRRAGTDEFRATLPLVR